MRPTCTECALKHLSQSSILLHESRHGYPGHIHYARGHMAEAEAELAKEYPEHADMVREERKKLEEDPGYTPDFDKLMEKIDTECEVCELSENPDGYRPYAWTKCELKYPSVRKKIISCVKKVEARQVCPPEEWGTSPSCVNPFAVCRKAIACPPRR